MRRDGGGGSGGADGIGAVLVLALAALALEGTVRLGWISPFTVAAPSAMFRRLAAMAGTGELWPPVVQTGRVVALAVAAACCAGVAGGLAVHRLPRLRRAIDPVLSSYFAVPVFVFYPLLIVLLGLGDAPLILIGASFSSLAVLVATLVALDRMPAAYVATARVMGLGRLATAWRVQLPAMAPHLLGGFKVAVAYAMIGVVGSEFILAPEGIGQRIAYAYNNFDNDTMYALMLLLVAAALLVNMALHAAERRLRLRYER